MKCKECGSDCYWLYYSKYDSYLHTMMSDERWTQTDYWYCPECETVYRQWIESKVHRDKYEPENISSVTKVNTDE